jgi:RHS repeat-associated protein
MPERPGPWELLDKPSDPVVADLPEVDARLAYFRSLAETMTTEGQRLSQIASGESLKGEYADKLRSDSGKVAKDLDQVVGRYEAVVQALTEYEPALDAALLGSSQALDDAIDASTALTAANAMPTATAPPGKQLTPQQEQANSDKAAATSAAADRLNAAKQKLTGVLSALDAAGQAAAAVIRKGFNDGLTDSAWDRFKYFFKKFLQILVKVLTYIGMALAVIALVIPGVGEAVLAATAAIGAVTLAANVGLKAMGDGSWADIAMSIAGLVTLGAAKVIGPAIQTGVKSITGAVRGADGGLGNVGKTADTEMSSVAGSKGASNGNDEVCTNGDPVDVATGDVLMTETDVSLPGLLPLVIERTHRSSWRTGRWFGRGWLSSLDQRLEVGAGRVRGAFADGRIVTWPVPVDDVAVVPESGPVWTLRRTSRESYEVHDPRRGLTWQYEQGVWDPGEFPLAAVSDRAGHEVSFSYDASGAPEAVTHSGGYRVDVTVAVGLVTALTVAGDDEPLRRYSYDEHGNLTGVVNSSGLPLRFSYDSEGRLTGWEDRNGQFYQYSYNEHGQCVSGEGAEGALSGTFSYGPDVTRWTNIAGATTTYELTESGRLAALTDPMGNTTRWERDNRGNVLAVADPLGHITRYACDDFGNVTTVARPNGALAQTEYDERCLPVSVTEADGSTWRQVFDERGHRTELTAPDGTVTRYGYDRVGHLASVNGPDGRITTVTCDAAGLPVAVTGPGGARTRYERDQSGRVRRIADPDGTTTAMTWTAEGKPASRTFPGQTTENWEWDGEGNLVRHVSPAGAVTTHAYGPFDKPAGTVWPDGTQTWFGYDHEQRVTSVSHGGLTWGYTYDPAGRLVAETDYNGAITSYEHNAAGEMTRRVNAVGQSVTYTRDAVGNVVSSDADGAVTTFSYDACGRLIRASNPVSEIGSQRDAMGRVTAETCDGRTVSTSYDPAGRVTGRITPSGVRTTWEYDTAGLPVMASAGGQELQFGYDRNGREISRGLPGGAVLAQDWDPAGQLSSQTLTGAGPSGTSVLQRRAYAYSPDGFVTGLDDLLAGTRAFRLDTAGRVTTVTGPQWAEQYGYDPAGNLTGASWPPMPGEWLGAESQGPREVSGTLVRRAGSVRYRHDAAGRVVSRTRISRKPETWSYEWDADNRLVTVAAPDGSAWRYSYDPLGRRVAKRHMSAAGKVLAETRFAWDGTVIAEQASADEVTTWDYRPRSFSLVAQTTSREPGRPDRDTPQREIDRQFYAIVTDLAGTPSEMVAADGTLAGNRQHTLWGGTAWNPEGASTPMRFPGQYADDETGFHYNNQRYYDPLSGSYLSPDPLGLVPAPNPHAYVANPHVGIDPLGLVSCTNSITSAKSVEENQAAIDARETGKGLSGIHNPETGEFEAYPSGTRDDPTRVVPRRGGHAQINTQNFGNSYKTVGFALTKNEDGSLDAGWLSRGVTGRNYPNNPTQYTASPEQQEAILQALRTATGRTVNG